MKSLKKGFSNPTGAKTFFLAFLLLFLTSCAKKPTVTTTKATNITAIGALSGGNVTTDGGASVITHGVCWSLTSNPTITDLKTTDGSGTGNYVSVLAGLTPITTYYVRAYATNRKGTAYGEQVNFTTDPATITDIDGNIYNVLRIGTQIWMGKNLNTTKYNDGTFIPGITANTTWSSLNTGAYCWYNNDPSTYRNTYGALYNWYTVNTGILCPRGWHVPSNAEWTTLTDYLGGTNVAGGKLKEAGIAHWNSPNAGATNESGFTSLPGGQRLNDGTFLYIALWGSWWSSTEFSGADGYLEAMGYNIQVASLSGNWKKYGLSVRCIKD